MALTRPLRIPLDKAGSCAWHTNNKGASSSMSNNSSRSSSSMTYIPTTQPHSNPKLPLPQVLCPCTLLLGLPLCGIGCKRLGVISVGANLFVLTALLQDLLNQKCSWSQSSSHSCVQAALPILASCLKSHARQLSRTAILTMVLLLLTAKASRNQPTIFCSYCQKQ